MAESAGFHAVDWVLFALTLVLSLGIGIWAALSGGRQKTTSEFLMGNRNLSPWAVSMSIFMSFISAILVLGNTAEMYLHGTQWWVQCMGAALAYCFIAVTFVPLFYPLKVTSSFEYLQMRFKGKMVRVTGNLLLILSQVIYMGLATFSPATALDAATGFPTWASILISGGVATIYTTIGGMKAVVWTDAIQGVIYLAGVITVLAVGAAELGGMDAVWKIADSAGRIRTFTADPNPLLRMSVWTNILGTFVASLQTVGTGQTSVQRYCAVSSVNKARLVVVLNAPAIILMFTLTCLTGLVVFAYYDNLGCDPLRAGEVGNPNQLLPHFIMEVVNIPGLPGVFLAVLFSGALSTLSSSLSGLSAVTWKDWLEPRFGHLAENKKALMTKGLTLVYGILGVVMAFAVGNLGSHVAQASSSFVSGVAGPLLGIFMVGFFCPWANAISTVIGAFTGLALVLWMSIGSYVTPPYVATLPTRVDNCTDLGPDFPRPPAEDPEDVFGLYKMSFQWFPAIGMATTCLVAGFLSLITGPNRPQEVDPRLIIPLFDRLFCCLPLSVRRLLWCGVNHAAVIPAPPEGDTKRSPMELKAAEAEQENVKVISYRDEKYGDLGRTWEAQSGGTDNAGYSEQ